MFGSGAQNDIKEVRGDRQVDSMLIPCVRTKQPQCDWSTKQRCPVPTRLRGQQVFFRLNFGEEKGFCQGRKSGNRVPAGRIMCEKTRRGEAAGTVPFRASGPEAARGGGSCSRLGVQELRGVRLS